MENGERKGNVLMYKYENVPMKFGSHIAFAHHQPALYFSSTYRCHAGLDPASRTAVVKLFQNPMSLFLLVD